MPQVIGRACLPGFTWRRVAATFVSVLVATISSGCAGLSSIGSRADEADRPMLMRMTPPTNAGTRLGSSVTCLVRAPTGSDTSADAFYLGRGPALLCVAYGRGEISDEMYRAALRDYASLVVATYASAALRAPEGDRSSPLLAGVELAELAQRTMAARALCHIAANARDAHGKLPAQAPSWCNQEAPGVSR
jgi:hypothetical protein